MNLENLHKQKTVISEGLSKEYAPVSTELLLKPFFDDGWRLNARKAAKGLGKEHLVLKHDKYIYSNGDFLTVELVNSRDGSAALNFFGGYGRLVCNNGLYIGDLEHGRFIHRGTSIYERLENKYEQIVAHLDTLKGNVETLQSRVLTEDALNNALLGIYKDVFEKDTKKYTAIVDVSTYDLKRLKRVRREADKKEDAFTVMNVIQENIIRYGALGCNVTTINKETQAVERAYKTKNASERSISSVGLNKTITNNFLKAVA